MTQTLEHFINAWQVKMTCEWADSNPNVEASEYMTRHFKCVLRRNGKQMTVPFSQGSAHTEEPTVADILDCLASDASSVDSARGFEDWASEFGYDTDSREAEKIYKACQKSAESLRRLLGEAAYEKLLWDTERL